MIALLLVLCAQPSDEEIDRHVRALGADAIEDREAATEKLVQIGERAVARIEAARVGASPEVARLMAAVLEKIQAKTDERETMKRIAALPETCRERTYRVSVKSRNRSPSMKVVLKTAKDGDGFALEDYSEWEHDGRTLWHRYTQTCAADRFLTARRVRSVYCTEESEPLVAEVKEGKATISLEGFTQNVKMTPRACTPRALLRLVGTLPQRKGASFAVDYFEVCGASLLPDTTLRCVGEEEVELGGKRVRAWMWEHAGASLNGHRYWVRDGVAVRAVLYAKTEDWSLEK